MSLSVTVRVWVRTVSQLSRNFACAKCFLLMAVWLPGAWALDVHVRPHAFVKRLWISDCYLKDPRSNLSAAKWEAPVVVPAAVISLCSAGWHHSRSQSYGGVAWASYLLGTVAERLPRGSEACLFVKNKICLSVTLFERILQSSK